VIVLKVIVSDRTEELTPRSTRIAKEYKEILGKQPVVISIKGTLGSFLMA
jgi:hypothetical protein